MLLRQTFKTAFTDPEKVYVWEELGFSCSSGAWAPKVKKDSRQCPWPIPALCEIQKGHSFCLRTMQPCVQEMDPLSDLPYTGGQCFVVALDIAGNLRTK